MLIFRILFILAVLVSKMTSRIQHRPKTLSKQVRKLQTASNVTSIATNTNRTSANSSANATIAPGSPLPLGKCHPTLLKAFGLSGPSNPSIISLDFCPLVTSSCCTLEDQNVIFNNWVTLKEGSNLDSKFQNFTDTINRFIKAAASVTQSTFAMMSATAGRPNNECSLLGRRVLSYQIEDMVPFLNSMFETSFKFLKTSYKGFYCTICDAFEGVNIKLDKKEFVTSEEFCRDLVIGTLPAARYFHIHMLKYLRLMAKLLTVCNVKGLFTPTPNPAGVMPTIDTSNQEILDTCFHDRNHDDIWFKSCKPYCQQFNINTIGQFFKPDFNQLSTTLTYIESQINPFMGIARPVLAGNATNGTNATAGNATAGNATTGNATAPVTTTPAAPKRRRLKNKRILKSHPVRRLKMSHPKKIRSHKVSKNTRFNNNRRSRRRLQGANATAPVVGNGTASAGNASASANGSASVPVKPPQVAADPNGPNVFTTVDSTSDIKLETFKMVYEDEGIDWDDTGLFSKFQKKTLRAIRRLQKIQAIIEKTSQSRHLKFEHKIGAFIGILIIALFRI